MDVQTSQEKDGENPRLFSSRHLQSRHHREWYHEQDDICDDARHSPCHENRRAIDARPGNIIVPCLGDGSTAEKEEELDHQQVRHDEYSHPDDRDFPCCSQFRESIV